MKKALISLLFVVVFAFVVPTSALAQTDTGPVPGSFWYGITTTFENVNLFFTFNAEKKAEKALNYAERHLTQAKTAVENENTNATEIALTDYEEKLTLATKSSKKIEDDEQAEKLLTTIADNTARHQETLSEVLEKVPEEAREAITKAMEASKRGQEEATQKIAELKGEVERLKQEVEELKQDSNDEQTAEIKKLKKEVEELKTENKNKKQGEITPRPKIEDAQLDTEKIRLEAEKAKTEAETAKARAEAERLQKETEAQQVAEEQKRLELLRQQKLKDQARELELQRQREAQRILEEQKQREQARVNQINNQIQSLLSEYNEKIAVIDRQILAIQQQYYEDEKNVKGRTIPMAFITGQIQKLAQEADSKINQLYIEQEALRLEYQGKIREFENQL